MENKKVKKSWNAMYIMDEHDKITINGYYCME